MVISERIINKIVIFRQLKLYKLLFYNEAGSSLWQNKFTFGFYWNQRMKTCSGRDILSYSKHELYKESYAYSAFILGNCRR